jgi:hypothetical protein
VVHIGHFLLTICFSLRAGPEETQLVRVAYIKGKGLRIMARRKHHSAKGHAEQQQFVSENCV